MKYSIYLWIYVTIHALEQPFTNHLGHHGISHHASHVGFVDVGAVLGRDEVDVRLVRCGLAGRVQVHIYEVLRTAAGGDFVFSGGVIAAVSCRRGHDSGVLLQVVQSRGYGTDLLIPVSDRLHSWTPREVVRGSRVHGEQTAPW